VKNKQSKWYIYSDSKEEEAGKICS